MTPRQTKLFEKLYLYLALRTPLEPAEVIVVGGCDDIKVALYAASLYQHHYAPRILFSGHQQAQLTKSEAEVYADLAMEEGNVPQSAILA